MAPLLVERTHIVVLNYNGRDLLAECLPVLVEAARQAPVPCGLTVLDNDSTDGSPEVVPPGAALYRHENLGLASFNRLLRELDEPVVILLNNDVKLGGEAIGPLLEVFRRHPDALFAAPQCWTFDGKTYEGMRTRVRMWRGLVQGLCRAPGYEVSINQADLTASAGPVLAVDRRKFLALGGYDPLYFPGRIEDLDLGFRGWMAGYRGYYVPESVAYHKGGGSFEPAFGRRGCEQLATRNSLLFAWKNLAGRRLWEHLFWLLIRVVHALVLGRGLFIRALAGALVRLRQVLARRRELGVGRADWVERQEAFYERFGWPREAVLGSGSGSSAGGAS